jgi:hypothetical protein
MHLGHVVVLPLLLTAGAAWTTPDSLVVVVRPQALTAHQVVRQQPAVPKGAPATPPSTPAAPAPAPRGKSTPAVPDEKTPPPQPPGKAVPPTALTPAAKTPATAPPLDLKALEQRLRNSKAIGLFTKITLKNQVDDLLDSFEEYYNGKSKHTIQELRRSYDLLLMKVLSLVQDKDQPLASSIFASREAIWALLADRKTFATLRA